MSAASPPLLQRPALLFCYGLIIGAVLFSTLSPQGGSQVQGSGAKHSDSALRSESAPRSHPRVSTVRAPRPREISRLLYWDDSIRTCQKKGDLIRQWGPEAVVVEVGAYHGEELEQFKGIAKRVYSFEPHPGKAAMVNEHIAKAGMQDTVVFKNAAVTDKAGMVKLYLPDDANVGSQQDSLSSMEVLNPNQRTVDVPGVTLDDEIKEHVHMLKIDTQGYELGVLRGAEKLIATYGVDIIHTEFSPNLMKSGKFNPADMLNWLYDHDYMCFYCTERFLNPQDVKMPMWQDWRESWDIDNFDKLFGSWNYMAGDHGAWGDLLCI